jgi:hypothetical protein
MAQATLGRVLRRRVGPRLALTQRPGLVLPLPDDLAADFEEYVTALRDEIEIMDREQAAVAAIGGAERIAEKPKPADRKSLKKAYREYKENFDTRSVLAKTLGFKVCSSD